MSKPRSTLPNPVESVANLTSALAQIGAEVDNQPLRSSALARIMRKTTSFRRPLVDGCCSTSVFFVIGITSDSGARRRASGC